MKKLSLVLVAAIMAFLIGNLMAGEDIRSPSSGETGNINADYGGVDFWSSTFSALVTTVALPVASLQLPAGTYGYYASTTIPNNKSRWRLYGVEFSTGQCGDFVDIWQSTGGFGATTLLSVIGSNISNTAIRVYNMGSSTGAALSETGAICSGVSPGNNGYRWPLRLKGNVYFRPNVGTYNLIKMHYWREPD